MNKKILLVNGSFNEVPLIDAAHRLGFYVITSGNDPKGEGHKFSDEYAPTDYSQPNNIYELAKAKKVDAICSCGNDFGAISASYACDKLGLPGHDSLQTCLYFHEKDQFKKLCDELGLNTPKSFSFASKEAAIKHLDNVRYPQIVKPSDLGGGKGISVINSYEEGLKAIDLAFQLSKVKTVLIEDYIQGEQHGFTCYIRNKKVEFVYYTDDYSYLNPYMVWTAIPHKRGQDTELVQKIVDDVEKMAKYANMHDGMLTIQLIIRDGEPFYIETMRRCLGNFHYRCMSWDLGVDVYELFVATEAGVDTSRYFKDSYELKSFSAFMGVYADKNGIFNGYSISEKYKKYVQGEMLVEQIGYSISDYLKEKLAMIFFKFDTEEERDHFVNNMRDIVKVDVK